jgi:hypothetical protein
VSFIKKKSKKIGYIFRCKTCKKETSPLKNIFFENSKLKIRNVLKIIYMYCSNYKVTQIMHELGIKNGHSVIDCETKLREICAFITLTNNDKIGGPRLQSKLMNQ